MSPVATPDPPATGAAEPKASTEALEPRLSERLAAHTLDLCAIPSVTGDERLLCDQLLAWASARQLPVKRIGNALHFSGGQPLLLCGHLDTVPDHPGDLPPRRAGDRLHGKGASDMKGGLAVALALFEDLPAPDRPHLLLYDREEGPNVENGLEPLLQAKFLPAIALAICLEPTDNRLQLGCVGSLHAAVHFVGKAAHSARPWEGANAVHAAGPVLTRLLLAEPHPVVRNGLTFLEVAQVTRASGGRARNVVPDAFELNVNYRFAPGVSLERAQADLRALIGPGPDLVFTDLSPSGETCAGNPELDRLQALGIPVEAKQAWTDVARLQSHGIPAVNFGPGQTAQAHQVDEWCEVAALGLAYRLLHRWLARGT